MECFLRQYSILYKYVWYCHIYVWYCHKYVRFCPKHCQSLYIDSILPTCVTCPGCPWEPIRYWYKHIWSCQMYFIFWDPCVASVVIFRPYVCKNSMHARTISHVCMTRPSNNMCQIPNRVSRIPNCVLTIHLYGTLFDTQTQAFIYQHLSEPEWLCARAIMRGGGGIIQI